MLTSQCSRTRQEGYPLRPGEDGDVESPWSGVDGNLMRHNEAMDPRDVMVAAVRSAMSELTGVGVSEVTSVSEGYQVLCSAWGVIPYGVTLQFAKGLVSVSLVLAGGSQLVVNEGVLEDRGDGCEGSVRDVLAPVAGLWGSQLSGEYREWVVEGLARTPVERPEHWVAGSRISSVRSPVATMLRAVAEVFGPAWVPHTVQPVNPEIKGVLYDAFELSCSAWGDRDPGFGNAVMFSPRQGADIPERFATRGSWHPEAMRDRLMDIREWCVRALPEDFLAELEAAYGPLPGVSGRDAVR